MDDRIPIPTPTPESNNLFVDIADWAGVSVDVVYVILVVVASLFVLNIIFTMPGSLFSSILTGTRPSSSFGSRMDTKKELMEDLLEEIKDTKQEDREDLLEEIKELEEDLDEARKDATFSIAEAEKDLKEIQKEATISVAEAEAELDKIIKELEDTGYVQTKFGPIHPTFPNKPVTPKKDAYFEEAPEHKETFFDKLLGRIPKGD